jgi:hypothetical protein
MRAQVAERGERLAGRNGASGAPRATSGALAVVAGGGLARLYASLGCGVLRGGRTLTRRRASCSPASTRSRRRRSWFLPNSPNVVLAAERAAELAEKEVRVVATSSQQAGLAAAVALNPARSAAGERSGDGGGARRACAPAAWLRPRAPTRPDASRRRRGRLRRRPGHHVGRPGATLRAVLERLATGAELVTVIAGADAPLDPEAAAALAPRGVEVEVEDGGQPSWWWLLALSEREAVKLTFT